MSLTIISFLAGIATPANAQGLAEVPRYKASAVRRVFDDIVHAVDGPPGELKLQVINRRNAGLAEYVPERNTLYVTERLYDLCLTFKSDSLNAMAAVLGHELAHHYRRHGTGGSLNQEETSRLIRKLTREQGDIEEETEADFFAGFYGQMAGYTVIDLAPWVLEKIYQEYSLPEKARGYLPLERRKGIALDVQKQLRHLLPVFTAATYLSLIKQYPEALRCYAHIMAVFPSRELLNNAGAVYTLQALMKMDGADIQSVYPIELDADSRMRGLEIKGGEIDRGTRTITPADRAVINALLDSAEARFTAAGRKDPRYAPALINLATVYILKGNYDEAMSIARSALTIDPGTKNRVLANTLLSIAHKRKGDSAQARERLNSIYEDAITIDERELVEANIAVMEKKEFRSFSNRGEVVIGDDISGLKPEGIISALEPDMRDTVPGEYAMEIASSSESVYRQGIRAQKGNSWTQFVSTTKFYEGSTKKDIAIGSPVSKVERMYGRMPRIINARKGKYYIYDYSKIIFLIGDDGHVQGWTLYAIG